jgi:uncharacterized cupredoxin-like copper-binding protein
MKTIDTVRTLAALTLAVVLGAGLGACDAEQTARQAPETVETGPGPTRSGGSAVTSADPSADPTTVKVSIKEFEVRRPTILTPGAHLFQVKNDGTEPHGLTVEGNGTSVSLPTNAQPGETQSLPVDLAPGTYRVYCSVDGHADRGMSVEITVSE